MMRRFFVLTAVVSRTEKPYYCNYGNNNPYSVSAKQTTVVFAARTRLARGTGIAIISHYKLSFLSAAMIGIFAATVVIIHKEKNYKNNKPEYGTATFSVATTISEEIKHKSNTLSLILYQNNIS